MTNLRERKCVPCERGVKPFNKNEIEEYKSLLSSGWVVIKNKRLKKEFPFNDFILGMEFARNIALIAEEEQHHPDLCIHYKSVDVEFMTHAIGGLSENDFIMAAKVDDISIG